MWGWKEQEGVTEVNELKRRRYKEPGMDREENNEERERKLTQENIQDFFFNQGTRQQVSRTCLFLLCLRLNNFSPRNILTRKPKLFRF